LTTYVSQLGTASLQFQDFITSTPQTAFQTTEVSRLQMCEEIPVETRRLQGDGDGDEDGAENQVSNQTMDIEVEVIPSQIFCGSETETSPGRVKMSIYGYTWGKNWETDAAGASGYVFYRWRLCFQSRSWYVNQVMNGEGIVDMGESVHVIDVQQEDGQPLAFWFPRFYISGDHLDCTFAQDLLWNLPKWECHNTETIGAVHVTASSAGGACSSDGLILNIGFQLEHLQQKDRWFLYMLEANASSTVTFASISWAIGRPRPNVMLVALTPLLLWISRL